MREGDTISIQKDSGVYHVPERNNGFYGPQGLCTHLKDTVRRRHAAILFNVSRREPTSRKGVTRSVYTFGWHVPMADKTVVRLYRSGLVLS